MSDQDHPIDAAAGPDPVEGDSGGGVPSDRLNELLCDARARLADNRRQLERRLEEGVRAYLSRLRFPAREELAALHSQLDGLDARTAALERREAQRSES